MYSARRLTFDQSTAATTEVLNGNFFAPFQKDINKILKSESKVEPKNLLNCRRKEQKREDRLGSEFMQGKVHKIGAVSTLSRPSYR